MTTAEVTSLKAEMYPVIYKAIAIRKFFMNIDTSDTATFGYVSEWEAPGQFFSPQLIYHTVYVVASMSSI